MGILKAIESWRAKTGKAFGQIIQNISKNKDWILELETLTYFLDPLYGKENISIQQRFYHVWFNFYEIEKCPYCSNPKKFARISKFSIDRYGIKPTNPVNYYGTCLEDACGKKYNIDKTQEGVHKKYGDIHFTQTLAYKENIKEKNQIKYGVDYYTETQEFKDKVKKTFESKYGGHPTKLKETQDKKKATNLEKYGNEHALNNEEVREKSNQTNQVKYGGNSSMCTKEIQEKSRVTNLERYGTDWYGQSLDFKEKFRKTMLERYGVEQVMQYAPFFEKSKETSHRKKIYEFPSGRIEKIQGYEGFGINDLLDKGYLEEDIIISNKEIEKYTGKIWYADLEKKRKYYPDIYIKSENKIIEVKCDYTYDTAYSINIRKRDASRALGISFEFWIYDDKGSLSIKY